jgi:hypothetical protein
LIVRWLSNASLVARFPFVKVSRGQLVTVFDGPASRPEDLAQAEARSA